MKHRAITKNHARSNITVNIIFLLTILILAFVIYTFLTAEDKNNITFLGYKPVIVKTGSMEPEIKTNALVILKKCNYDQVNVGDIIAFHYEDAMVMHQVIEKNEEGLRTKGTNNNAEDDYVITREMVFGKKVWHTNFTSKLNSPVTIGILIVLIISLIVLIKLFKSFFNIDKATPHLSSRG